jgi:hypothetical protein
VTNLPTDHTLPPTLDAVVREHLELLHAQIVRRAFALADEVTGMEGLESTSATVSRSLVAPTHVLKALAELAPGYQVVSVLSPPPKFWDRFASSVSPITLISAVLTIVFAAFGLWALVAAGRGSVGGQKVDGSAYLDIAKIFAGAIVGSASVTATTARSIIKSAPLDSKAKPKR